MHRIRVGLAAPVVETPAGPRILVTRRSPNSSLPDAWELPGGGREPGEDPGTTALRELEEETGLRAPAAIPLIRTRTLLPDGILLLYAYLVRVPIRVAATPHDPTLPAVRLRGPVDHRWLDLDAFASWPFPPGNAPITAAIVRAVRAGITEGSDMPLVRVG